MTQPAVAPEILTSDESDRRIVEQRLVLALEVAGGATWDWNPATGALRWSAGSGSLFGDAAGSPATFEAFLERVHTADRDRVAQAMADGAAVGSPFDLEFRVVDEGRPDRWIRAKGTAPAGSAPPRMLGVFVDVTCRHDAERQLHDLGGRLIAAQEQERSRLSRELHDDISQRLTLLSIAFDELRGDWRDGSEQMRARADVFAIQLQELASTLHRVSHELHPAVIRQVGFERALRTLCSDIERAHQVVVDCQCPGSERLLDRDVELGLYRIAQEALTNAVKHSGARRASVSIEASDDGIVLAIADAGAGFDAAALADRDSLGLISMRERVRFMNGRLNVISSPGGGTRIEVVVPFDRS